MKDTKIGQTLIGPKVEPIGYKHIVKTIHTGELIDADCFIYSVTDTKSDSTTGRTIRYYEGSIEERTASGSIDSDRVLLNSTFEITEDLLDKPHMVYDAVVSGTVIDVSDGVWVMTGPDIQYYGEVMRTLADTAATYLSDLKGDVDFDFDAATYNNNVYDTRELDSAISAIKDDMVDADMELSIDMTEALDRDLEHDLDMVEFDLDDDLINTTENQYAVWDEATGW